MHNAIKVLIVDDEPLVRLHLKTTLAKAGKQMLLLGEASNGHEAVAQASRLRPDVILMDISMPQMDGIAATRVILQSLKQIHIIMLTSHTEDHLVLEAFGSGATSYCSKDNSPDILLHAISSTAAGESWIDPKVARVVLQGLSGAAQLGPHNRPGASTTVSGQNLVAPLSERELEVLRLIAEGQNNASIADALCISLNTVKTHVKNIFGKLEVEDRTAAAMKAYKEQLLD